MLLSDVEEYFKAHQSTTYSRENYDHFINDKKFRFNVPSIHITGTNGKGSTANYLYQIYLAQGYKVGLFTSPYVTNVCEMISVNGKNISEDEYVELFISMKNEFEEYHLTSFEMQTIIAYSYFQNLGLDLVIIEVGMGGFIDATNIITPELSIITSISLEHTNYLGKSLSEIAYNKSGIIKQNVDVLLGKLDDSSLFAIRERAKKLEAPITIVDDYHNERFDGKNMVFDYRPYSDLKINTIAEYQLSNASLAVEATKILNAKFNVSEEALRKGLLTNLLPCRYEKIGNVIIDGAHNADGIENLVKSVEKHEHQTFHIVFATFRDKNVSSMLISLERLTRDITLTTFNHPRARTKEEYFLYLGDYQFTDDYMSKIHELSEIYKDDLILVTGSLCFAGIVRKNLLTNDK